LRYFRDRMSNPFGSVMCTAVRQATGITTTNKARNKIRLPISENRSTIEQIPIAIKSPTKTLIAKAVISIIVQVPDLLRAPPHRD
jgi:hypothetical protein